MEQFEQSHRESKSELDDHSFPARIHPNLYDGEIQLFNGKVVSVQEAAERVRCAELIERCGRWAITDYGIECLALDYSILYTRIHERNWLMHLKPKKWFSKQDEEDFSDILATAKQHWPQIHNR